MIFCLFVKKNPDLSRKRKKSHDDGPPAKRSKSEVEGEVQQMLTLQAIQYESEIIYQAHSKKVYCTCKVTGLPVHEQKDVEPKGAWSYTLYISLIIGIAL